MPQTPVGFIESVRKYGVLRPIYYWKGEVLDGRKTLAAAKATRQEVPVRIDFATEDEARHYLFHAHPRRALRRWPCSTAREACELFGATISQVASYFQPQKKKKSPGPWRRTGARTRGKLGGSSSLHVAFSAELRNQLKAWASEIGVSESEYVRGALLATTPDRVRSRLIAISVAGPPALP